MGFDVSFTTEYQLENKDVLKNVAKNILNRSGSDSNAAQKILDTSIFDSNIQGRDVYSNAQLAILKASTQISVNDSLKATLKYLKSHAANKTQKKNVFGELWEIFSANNQQSEENPYKGELYDFEIDKNAENIFAA